MGVYLQEEVDAVIEDLNMILDKYSGLLLNVMNDISTAKFDLNAEEALVLLKAASDSINRVNLMSVVDTLEGIIQDSKS